MKKLLGLIILSITVSSCAMFDEPRKTKIPGIDDDVMVDQIDGMSKDGTIGDSYNPYLGDGFLGGDKDKTGKTKPDQIKLDKDGNPIIPKDIYSQIEKSATGYRVATPNIGQPVRNGEKVQKIYIFPYQDAGGNYHETSIMYAILKKPHWVDYPVQQVKHDDYDIGYEVEDYA